MTKYRISRYSAEIEAVAVVRETDKTVVVSTARGGRRHAKAPDFFDTWEAARDALLDRCQREVNSLKARLSVAEGALESVRGLKAPKEAA